MQVRRLINKAFLTDTIRDLFLYEIIFLVGIYCLSMRREVLESIHGGTLKLLNPKRHHRTEEQSMEFIYQSIISMLCFIL